MMKLVNMLDLGSNALLHEGSSPSSGNKKINTVTSYRQISKQEQICRSNKL